MNKKNICIPILVLFIAAGILSNTPVMTRAGTTKSVPPTSPNTEGSAHKTDFPATNIMATIKASSALTNHAYLALVAYTPAGTQGQLIIADHSVLAQFTQIPQNAIDTAASQKTLFMHQSTGGYIADSGLGCLAGLHGNETGYPQECTTYAGNRSAGRWPWYDKSNWDWDYWPTPTSDALVKVDEFVNIVQARAGNYQVMGMKYCYIDGWNQGTNVAQSHYIDKMLEMEQQYPGKTFIWATSALWENTGGGACNGCKEIAEFNQQVRAYAKAHNKPLFDIADIESHDRNGNTCVVSGYEGMCADWYLNDGGHPNVEGSIRLAKGFWWLMARINGWNGQ